MKINFLITTNEFIWNKINNLKNVLVILHAIYRNDVNFSKSNLEWKVENTHAKKCIVLNQLEDFSMNK